MKLMGKVSWSALSQGSLTKSDGKHERDLALHLLNGDITRVPDDTA